MDSPYAFRQLKKIFIANQVYKIQEVKVVGEFAIVKAEGVDTVEEAEKFRNKEIFALREDMPPLPQGRYYIDDLLGCQVIVSGKPIGKVYDILQNGAADVFCVDGEKKVMFPYAGDVIERIDIEDKKIYISQTEFDKWRLGKTTLYIRTVSALHTGVLGKALEKIFEVEVINIGIIQKISTRNTMTIFRRRRAWCQARNTFA